MSKAAWLIEVQRTRIVILYKEDFAERNDLWLRLSCCQLMLLSVVCVVKTNINVRVRIKTSQMGSVTITVATREPPIYEQFVFFGLF